MSYKEEFKYRTCVVGVKAALLALVVFTIMERLKNTFSPGNINNWIGVDENGAEKVGLVGYFVLAVVTFLQVFAFTSGSLQRPIQSKGLISKISKTSVAMIVSNLIVLFTFVSPNTPFFLKSSFNEVNVITITYFIVFCSKTKSSKSQLLEHSANNISIHYGLHTYVLDPLTTSLKTAVLALPITFLVYVPLCLGSLLRMLINTIGFQKDQRQIDYSLFSLWGFLPIIFVLGSRLVFVTVAWNYVVKLSFILIKMANLTTKKSPEIFKHRSLNGYEFEAQQERNEILQVLRSSDDSIRSKFFEMSGIPKQPLWWNATVESCLKNIDKFVESQLLKKEEKISTTPKKKEDPKKNTNMSAPLKLSVKVWSDKQRTITDSPLISNEMRKSYAENQKLENNNSEKQENKPTLMDQIHEEIDKKLSKAVEYFKTQKELLVKKLDEFLGTDIYDTLPSNTSVQTVFSITTQLSILQLLVKAMSTLDTENAVFKSKYPLFKITRELFKLNSALDKYEQDQNRDITNKEIENLRFSTTTALTTILMSFPNKSIQNDMSRPELRDFRPVYEKLVKN